MSKTRLFLCFSKCSLAAALAGFALSPAALGQAPPTPSFELIADYSTPVPGGSGNFSLFADAKAIEGERVVFVGYDSGSGSGIYRFENGVLERWVDENTQVPGTSDFFQIFFDVELDGGIVTFSGGWPGPGGGCAFSGSEGVFADRFQGGALQVVSDSLSSVNHCYHGVALDRGILAFAGGVDPVDVIHNHSESIMATTAPGTFQVVFDTTTASPSGGTFFGYDQDFVLRNGRIMFTEVLNNTFGAVAGVYTDYNDGFGPRLVADANTAIPGGSGNFKNFAGVDWDGDEVAFVGRDSGNASALYAGTSPSNLRVVVNTATPVPGETSNFLGISNPIAYDDGVFVFSGYWAGGGYGLFAEANGAVYSILKKGEILDGRVVEQAFCKTQNKDGRRLLIEVRFQPALSHRGLYLVRY
ncbi:MAG: hypothetical protein DWQ01_19460 [Planctomycetota bacterium]|nr:MAG: hypothetical protein DWQ01_19460 [Planctomycetota bacterium]